MRRRLTALFRTLALSSYTGSICPLGMAAFSFAPPSLLSPTGAAWLVVSGDSLIFFSKSASMGIGEPLVAQGTGVEMMMTLGFTRTRLRTAVSWINITSNRVSCPWAVEDGDRNSCAPNDVLGKLVLWLALWCDRSIHASRCASLAMQVAGRECNTAASRCLHTKIADNCCGG